MPKGSVEGAARLSQGGRAGRGSFLRLVGAGIGAVALNQLEPAQNALAKTTTREQKRVGQTASGNEESKHNDTLTTPSTQTRTEQADVLFGLPEPVIITAAILGIAGIGGVVLNRIHSRRHRERRRRERQAEIERQRQRTATPPVSEPQVEIRSEPPALVQLYHQYHAEQERLEAEERARELERQRQLQLEELRRQQKLAEEQAIAERKKKRNLEEGTKACEKLTKEVQEKGLNQLAEGFKQDFWLKQFNKNALARLYRDAVQEFNNISLQPITEPAVVLNDDGTERENLSKSGITISYEYRERDFLTETIELAGDWHETRFESSLRTIKQELTLGIGFFSKREELIPEAQASVSEEELQKGIKAYFIRQRCTSELYNDNRILHKPNTTTTDVQSDTIAIPYAYPEAEFAFLQHSLESFKRSSPIQVIPGANRRLEEKNRREQGNK